MTDGIDPVARSQACLRAARTGDTETTAACWEAFAAYDSDALAAALADTDRRTAFWLNVYNAAVQDALREDPGRYDSRLRFFVSDRVTVAGKDLSLNDIEHGILRRSRTVFGLGYLPRVLQSRFERRHRVDALDSRIHFALNCGAASCPPIAAYSAERLDEELTLATESYLGSEVAYEAEAGVVRVPRLFLWYYGDFGGRGGIFDLLRRYGPLPEADSPKLRFRSYDWSLELDNFRDSSGTQGASVDDANAVQRESSDASPEGSPEASPSSTSSPST